MASHNAALCSANQIRRIVMKSIPPASASRGRRRNAGGYW